MLIGVIDVIPHRFIESEVGQGMYMTTNYSILQSISQVWGAVVAATGATSWVTSYAAQILVTIPLACRDHSLRALQNGWLAFFRNQYFGLCPWRRVYSYPVSTPRAGDWIHEKEVHCPERCRRSNMTRPRTEINKIEEVPAPRSYYCCPKFSQTVRLIITRFTKIIAMTNETIYTASYYNGVIDNRLSRSADRVDKQNALTTSTRNLLSYEQEHPELLTF